MSVAGVPSDWVDLIDTLVPNIMDLVSSTWLSMPDFPADTYEDPITETFCRLLRQNRSSSDLPFQIHTQMVELDPAAGEEQGRLDIAFLPLVPREDIYFCLECKRLNVPHGAGIRSYSTEYVTLGMIRFVRGKYASVVRHGGMLGYVLNGNVEDAIGRVRQAIRDKYKDLGMAAPGDMQQSSIKPSDSYIKETQHHRGTRLPNIQIHHIFVPRKDNLKAPPKKSP